MNNISKTLTNDLKKLRKENAELKKQLKNKSKKNVLEFVSYNGGYPEIRENENNN